MGVSTAKFTDPDGLAVNIEQIGGMIVKAVNDEMHALALAVRDRARQYVPVDEGFAEKSIKVEQSEQRRRWSVYIDMDEEATHDGRTYTVGDYILWLHEGRYNLGEKSLQKNATLTQGFVGPQFLTRAIDDVAGSEEIARINRELSEAIAQRKLAKTIRSLQQKNAEKELDQ